MTRSEDAQRQVETVAAERESPETAGAEASAEGLVETLVEEVSIDGMCGVY
jgi:mycofactocin precursor